MTIDRTAIDRIAIDRLGSLAAALAVSAVWSAAFVLLPNSAGAQTASGNSSIGVVVDPAPTTTTTTEAPPPPPPATEAPQAPPTTEAIFATPAAPVPEAVPIDGTTTTTTPTATVTTTVLPEIRQPDADAPAPPEDTLVAKAVKSTTKLLKDVISGKAVADAVQEALPEPVAAVVVPAVRTASTFAFPIGLAGAVFAFLVLQQRIDSSDPKLTAAPLAHDDDVIEFR